MARTERDEERLEYYFNLIQAKVLTLEPIKADLVMVVMEELDEALSPLKILKIPDRIVGLECARDFIDYLLDAHRDRQTTAAKKEKEGEPG